MTGYAAYAQKESKAVLFLNERKKQLNFIKITGADGRQFPKIQKYILQNSVLQYIIIRIN